MVLFNGHQKTTLDNFFSFFLKKKKRKKERTAKGIKTCSGTGQRHYDTLRGFVISQLQQRACLKDIIVMQNGASPLIDYHVKQLLR